MPASFPNFSMIEYEGPKDLHSFPTRRSSDLKILQGLKDATALLEDYRQAMTKLIDSSKSVDELDRKSTRLNSSHRCKSYAVFCLKKKKARTLRGLRLADATKNLPDKHYKLFR